MKTFAQILYGRAHWIFTAPEKPEFAPDIILIDITDFDLQPKEGWLYDEETGKFSEPPEPEPVEPMPDPVDEVKAELLTTQTALAALYEDNLRLSEENLTTMQALAALYETIGGEPK